MIHTITNNNYSAQISELGAELKSFKNNKGFEFIWIGNPDIWSGTAPILFPFVGKLKNDSYTFNGKTYKMNKHGFARKRSFEVLEKKESEISFILRSDNETKESYPFDFELIVEFEINAGILTVSYIVINKGNDQMYFTIGSHPAFKLETDYCKLNDYYVEFEKKENLDCYLIDGGLLAKDTISHYMNNENTIQLSKDIFNDDALVFKNIKSKQITIKNDITGSKLKVMTGGAPHIGIWAIPAAPYVCIEPWYGFADSVDGNGELINKEGMIKLQSRENFITGYQIIG